MDTKRASSLMEAFTGKHIAVIGDLMLDRYIWGVARRISQEAPVPVVTARRTTAETGGAANVLRNIATLGGNALAFGIRGDDDAGRELEDLLRELGIDPEGILIDPARRTTEKTRVIAGNQQVVRLDTEDVEPLDNTMVDRLLQTLAHTIKHRTIDAIIVEDYAKGGVTRSLLEHIVTLAATYEIPVALDPHPSNPFNVQGLTLMTPNRAEAFALAGTYLTDGALPVEDDIRLLGVVNTLHQRWNAENLLVTLGGDGMALFHGEDAPLHVPTRAREVSDVSGAGDTVIASFVMALVGGASPAEAADFSNHAAGVVVGKVGTAPVHPEEILADLSQS